MYPRIPRELLPKDHVRIYLFLGPRGLLTQSQWFPDAYYGQGQRGHRYHVFDEVGPGERNTVSPTYLRPAAFILQASLIG